MSGIKEITVAGVTLRPNPRAIEKRLFQARIKGAESFILTLEAEELRCDRRREEAFTTKQHSGAVQDLVNARCELERARHYLERLHSEASMRCLGDLVAGVCQWYSDEELGNSDGA